MPAHGSLTTNNMLSTQVSIFICVRHSSVLLWSLPELPKHHSLALFPNDGHYSLFLKKEETKQAGKERKRWWEAVPNTLLRESWPSIFEQICFSVFIISLLFIIKANDQCSVIRKKN
jgi:hypothetical protein